jgi:uncharacterized membrane protein
MTIGDRLIPLFLYSLGILFVAGVVHLVAVLTMPEVAANDAFARLSKLGRPGQLILLPQPRPGHMLTPFEDPAVTQAVCLYDLSQGSLHLRGTVDNEGFLSLSFRSRDGRVFYAMTDKAANHGNIDVRVLTAAQLDTLQSEDDEDNPPQEIRLVAPQMQGFVLIDAIAAYPSERDDAEARVKSISCAPEAVAQN